MYLVPRRAFNWASIMCPSVQRGAGLPGEESDITEGRRQSRGAGGGLTEQLRPGRAWKGKPVGQRVGPSAKQRCLPHLHTWKQKSPDGPSAETSNARDPPARSIPCRCLRESSHKHRPIGNCHCALQSRHNSASSSGEAIAEGGLPFWSRRRKEQACLLPCWSGGDRVGPRGRRLYFHFNETLPRGWLKFTTIRMTTTVFPNKGKLSMEVAWRVR